MMPFNSCRPIFLRERIAVICRIVMNPSTVLYLTPPPYMHTPGGTAHVNHQNYEGYYGNNKANSNKKYHEAVLDLYFTAAREAWRSPAVVAPQSCAKAVFTL